MISIKEIAALAGVSRGTVDRALNNRGEVNGEVAERIRKIAEEHGYKTNRAALALAARKKKMLIGVIFPAEGNPFFEDVLQGVRDAQKAYEDFGITVSLKTMKGYSADEQIRLINELEAEGIQGLIIAASNEKSAAHRINALIRKGIPVVAANTDIENTKRLCYVGQDYVKSGEIAAGLMGLVADGRPLRTIILTGSIRVLGHNQRITGFDSAVKRNYPNITIQDIFETLDDFQTAYALVKEIVRKQPVPDAIYMTAGGVGGACMAIEESGYAGKIKLFTHDCTSESRPYLEKGVISATLGQEPYRQGYLPVKLLYDYFLDKKKPETDRIYTNCDIIIRENI